MQKAPGKSDRVGLTLIDLVDMFGTEHKAREWIEKQRCLQGAYCPHCGSFNVTAGVVHKSMTHRCNDCSNKTLFSVRVGTVMQCTKLSYRTWALAIYLFLTNLKGISSMKVYRELGIRQATSWFLLQRLRQAFANPQNLFTGPAEADETYTGGREKNKHESRKLNAGRGGVGKCVIAGLKDHTSKEVIAKVIARADRLTLQGFVNKHLAEGAKLYTDESAAYKGIDRPHESVNHSVGEYVRKQVHTNGIESFWATLKRASIGVYHKMSPKHLQRYVDEFAGRHNVRSQDTLIQMNSLVAGMVNKRLRYVDLIADNGLSSLARPLV